MTQRNLGLAKICKEVDESAPEGAVDLDEIEGFERENNVLVGSDSGQKEHGNSNSEYPPETYEILSWSALQFIHAPDSAVFFWTGILITVMLGVSIGLGNFIKLDITIDGVGEVASDIGLKEAVTAAEGSVSHVYKKTGDLVTEGDLIATIATDNMSEDDVKSTINTLSSNLKILEQAKNPEQINIPMISLATSKILDTAVLQSLVNIEQNTRNFLEQKSQIRSRLSRELEPLEKRLSFLNSNLTKMNKSRQRDLLKYYAYSTTDEIGKLKAQIATTRNQALDKLDQTHTDLIYSIRYGLGAFESYHSKHEIHAPISGTIAKLDIASNTHIALNKVVATFIPLNSKFIAKIRIKSKDIIKVHSEQTVLYKVDAYPFQKYGLFNGAVEAFDQIKTESGVNDSSQSGSNPDKMDDFVVRGSILPPMTFPEELKSQLKFVSGMTFKATIVTDRKSVDKIIYERVFPHFR
jgi:multidrug resistance efflux pump